MKLRPIEYTEADLDVMARTVWGEARGQGTIGMVGVAWCIRNRVELDLGNDGKPDWWGEGVSAVCQRKYQFSCWNPGDPNAAKCRAIGIADPGFASALKLCEQVLRGQLTDPTNGATHYHTRNVSPAWSLGRMPCAVIKDHLFYKGV